MSLRNTVARSLSGALVLGWAISAVAEPERTISVNDNRHAAGALGGGTLTVRIYADQGDWRPEENDGPALTVAAFGEEGSAPSIPGPLLRVPTGATVVVQVRNALTDRLDIHGLVTHPADHDAVISVAPGETREVRFAAGAPGTYHYWATTRGANLNARRGAESQLGGAFIVDPPGTVAADRVFVMTEWDDTRVRVDEIVNADVRRVFAINGRSWPHTERLDERIGRETRYHIVNLTQAGHPMHLHGFYFSVRSVGTGLRQTMYTPGEYRQVVTEGMNVGSTLQMAWTPERVGNWLLHCHLIAHVTPALRFWAPTSAQAAVDKPQPSEHDHDTHANHDVMTGMAGLVMGIRVTGDSEATARSSTVTPARKLTLAMHRRAGYWHPEDGYGFALAKDGQTPDAQEATVPGPVLVLKRNEPVEITLVNNLPEATAIHWHGIELESYYDGVPGWGSNGVSTTPPIVPGEQFVVRFTPPRAGTFIYHTHSHDTRQLASGLYGAIVVLEPGETFDPERDHVLVLGMEGDKDTQRYERFPVVVNGRRDTMLTLKAGVPNRLRFVNITTNFGGLNVSLTTNNNQPIVWKPVAKDGADLPLNQQEMRPAVRQTVNVGETYDFVVDPPPAPANPFAAAAWLDLKRGGGEWVQQIRVKVAP
jgi:FtsP/CotA-like multicopper oxidase with cupredoxin domain